MIDNTKLLELADLFDKQADIRRENAISARKQKTIVGIEADEWASTFATSYQTLRGIAAAVWEWASD